MIKAIANNLQSKADWLTPLTFSVHSLMWNTTAESQTGMRQTTLQQLALGAEGNSANYHTPNIRTGCAKKCPKLFLTELHQICTKFDNFWHTDSQDDRIM